ncbi:MAG TPA: VOC family protein [Gaiellaceae bacterium]|nr:VOC family protein [Gaiellaceae bacterium]
MPVARTPSQRKELEGFKGGYVLVDHEDGRTMTVTLWENHAAMDASESFARSARNEAAGAVGGDVLSVEKFEVAQELRPELHSGRYARAVARLVGINHVALEVGDVEEALEWYGRIFDFELRGRGPGMAFVDLGDQFIALSEGRTQPPDSHRHLGLVVDDSAATRAALEQAGAEMLPGRGLNFRDPWGNFVQVVAYADVQFTKAPEILRGMQLEVGKSDRALAELREKGLA